MVLQEVSGLAEYRLLFHTIDRQQRLRMNELQPPNLVQRLPVLLREPKAAVVATQATDVVRPFKSVSLAEVSELALGHTIKAAVRTHELVHAVPLRAAHFLRRSWTLFLPKCGWDPP